MVIKEDRHYGYSENFYFTDYVTAYECYKNLKKQKDEYQNIIMIDFRVMNY